MRTTAVVSLALLATAGGLALWVARSQRELELELPALDTSRPRPQGGFFVGASSEPPHLNPLTTTDAVARRLILRYTHDTLLDRDLDSGALCPAVAEAVDLEPGGGALAVRLRGDVRFADGTPLTVDDLEFVFRAAKAPGAMFGSAREVFDLLDAFERQGERAFRLRVKTPHFSVRGVVGIGYPVVQARYWRAAVAALAEADGQPAPAEGSAEFSALLARVALPGPGTGAYALGRDARSGAVAWRHGVELVLVQNPLSWRRRAQPTCWNLMGIRLRFLEDAAARLAELRGGRLDWYVDDDAEAVLAADPALQQRVRLLEYVSPSVGHHMVVWNLRRQPYDVRVRRALSMLFDRRAIVDQMLRGRGRAAAAWFRPGEPEYPSDLEPMPFDVAEARRLLQEAGVVAAGVPRPTVRIFSGNQLALHRRILEAAVPAFAGAGLDLRIERREWADVLERCEKSHDFDGVMMSWNHEPWIDPFASFHSSQAAALGKNYSGLQDAAVDALLVAARAEFDGGARAARYRELAHVLHGLAPVSLLVHPRLVLLLDRRFQDAEPGALGIVADRLWESR